MVFERFRKRQRFYLWVVVVLTISTFTVFSVSSAVRSWAHLTGRTAAASFRLPSGKTVRVDPARLHATQSLLDRFGRHNSTREEALEHVILVELARDGGLGVAQEEVRKAIVEMGERGQAFSDDDSYRKFLRAMQLSTSKFETFVGEILLIQRLRGIFDPIATLVSDDDLYARFRDAREELRATLLRFPAEGFAPETPASDEALRAYYDGLAEPQRKAQFPGEPSFRVEAAVLPVEGRTEEELRKLLGENQAAADETVDALARRVVEKALTDFRTAEAARDLAAATDPPAGETAVSFDDVATKLGLTVVRTPEARPAAEYASLPDLGDDPELPEAIRGLRAKDFTAEPRRSSLGWYFLHVVERKEAEALPFEAAREKVAEAKRLEDGKVEARRVADETRARIREKARELASTEIAAIEAEIASAVDAEASAQGVTDEAEKEKRRASKLEADGRVLTLTRAREAEAFDAVVAERSLAPVTPDPFPKVAPPGLRGEMLPADVKFLGRLPSVTTLVAGQVSEVLEDPVQKVFFVVRLDGRRFPEKVEMTPRDRYDFENVVRSEKTRDLALLWSFPALQERFDVKLYDVSPFPRDLGY